MIWANYIPEIYGMAKALLALRDTDEAAAAAWDDRMQALYQGCAQIVECLKQNGVLAPQWTVETGADIFWAMISLATWEHLTVERGWSQAQYIERMQWMLRRTLTLDNADPFS
jgi:hypothetical protein